jgi:hypothetical protein
MIIGKKKEHLTTETILKKISEYDIFRWYMPTKSWKINQVTFSPFRNERNPSFLIGNKLGNLSFIDFTDTSKKGDCFTFVKLLFNLSNINETLVLINKDFNLGILSGKYNVEYKKIIEKYKQPESEGKRYSLIQVITKSFTQEELNYWNSYYQDVSDLRRENVYSISKVYLNKQRFAMNDNDLKFGYFYDGFWKIYRPFQAKKNKWVPNNVPITTMDGKRDIINCDTAFISKSKKDYMVIKKVFPCVCAVQNEGVGCFSKENVEYLKANSDKQVLGFDSDEPGVVNSQQITKMFDFGYINVPRTYLLEGINDFADLGKIHGLKTIENYFKQKKLI